MKMICAVILLAAGALPADAATLTVGPHGTYSTIQQALDAALGSVGDDLVKIENGTYNEAIYVDSASADQVTLSGGWNSTFTAQVRSGSAVIQPAAGNTALDLRRSHGGFALVDLAVKDAFAYECAGLHIVATGDSAYTADGLRVSGNVAAHLDSVVRGGGACIDAADFASVEIVNAVFENNVATAEANDAPTSATGGGLSVHCDGVAYCHIGASQFIGNGVDPYLTLGAGAGIEVLQASASIFEMTDVVFEGQTTGAGDGVYGLSAYFVTQGDSAGFVDRVQFRGAGLARQYFTSRREVSIAVLEDSQFKMLNSLIAQAAREGLYAYAESTGLLSIGQCTFAGNRVAPNIANAGTTSARIYDNIFWNPDDSTSVYLAGKLTDQGNLKDFDPRFTAPSLFDYSLRKAGSPAMDAGNPGAFTVSTADPKIDIAGAARTQGAAVDIGAWESSDRVYADRFDP